MIVEIVLEGCDDTTRFDIEVDEKELALLKKIAGISIETSGYECMPKMYVRPCEKTGE